MAAYQTSCNRASNAGQRTVLPDSPPEPWVNNCPWDLSIVAAFDDGDPLVVGVGVHPLVVKAFRLNVVGIEATGVNGKAPSVSTTTVLLSHVRS